MGLDNLLNEFNELSYQDSRKLVEGFIGGEILINHHYLIRSRFDDYIDYEDEISSLKKGLSEEGDFYKALTDSVIKRFSIDYYPDFESMESNLSEIKRSVGLARHFKSEEFYEPAHGLIEHILNESIREQDISDLIFALAPIVAIYGDGHKDEMDALIEGFYSLDVCKALAINLWQEIGMNKKSFDKYVGAFSEMGGKSRYADFDFLASYMKRSFTEKELSNYISKIEDPFLRGKIESTFYP